MSADLLHLIILPAGLVAIAYALYLARDVLRRDTGTREMEAVAATIFEGAVAFIRRQYVTIAILALVGAVALGILISAFETENVADTDIFGVELGVRTAIAFLVGAACSMASGIIGMYISVKANVRTAAAARRSLVEAVQVAMRGGAVSGFLMVGTIAGVLLATVLNNGGGAWDNAKKYIESGHLRDAEGVVMGKKSSAHTSAVVGDTVGDPFKDTAGPSLHVLVKLLATITLVLAPLFIG